MDTNIKDDLLLELAIGLLWFMFISVYFDTRRTKRKEALCIFAEIEDKFFGVEGTMLRSVNLLSHLNRKLGCKKIF